MIRRTKGPKEVFSSCGCPSILGGLIAGLDRLPVQWRIAQLGPSTQRSPRRTWYLGCRASYQHDFKVNRGSAHSATSTAVLSRVVENGEGDPVGDLLDIGAVKHQDGGLASELERDLFQVGLGSGDRDSSTCDDGTGERDLRISLYTLS